MDDRFLLAVWDGQKLHKPPFGARIGTGILLSHCWGAHDWGFYNGDVLLAGSGDGRSKLLQCTGLKDENGTLIWEGDIVKDSDDGLMGVVFWNKGDAAFDVKGRIQGDEDVDEWDCGLGAIASYCVTLGNIYENPELLPE